MSSRLETASATTDDYSVPDGFADLNELGATSPTQNPDERHHYQTEFLEDRRSREPGHESTTERSLSRSTCDDSHGRPEAVPGEERSSAERPTAPASTRNKKTSKAVTTLYTLSHLVLFSVLGTLGRLGIEALTTYPDQPVTTSTLWANFAGSFFMGFLSEDRKLFRDHGASHAGHGDGGNDAEAEGPTSPDAKVESEKTVDQDADKKAHMTLKKTIPLYIGLTTGFCGSFTSFSAFIRDVYLALSHGSPDGVPATSRNGGYSFLALVGIITLTLCLCLSALKLGAHVAIALEPVTPALPVFLTRQVVDRCTAALAWAMWLGAVIMAIWPPDRPSGPAAAGRSAWWQETWRGEVLFALVFGPLGTLARFYASIRLNSIFITFPLGTFAVNVVGTAILGIAWDVQHAPLGVQGGPVACQVLQGVQNGFCGCLTTVSTWVIELAVLQRKHAYFYGAVSVATALGLLVIIMGSLQWTRGFSQVSCSQ